MVLEKPGQKARTKARVLRERKKAPSLKEVSLLGTRCAGSVVNIGIDGEGLMGVI